MTKVIIRFGVPLRNFGTVRGPHSVISRPNNPFFVFLFCFVFLFKQTVHSFLFFSLSLPPFLSFPIQRFGLGIESSTKNGIPEIEAMTSPDSSLEFTPYWGKVPKKYGARFFRLKSRTRSYRSVLRRNRVKSDSGMLVV